MERNLKNLLVFLIAFLWTITNVFAGMAVSPLKQEITVKPGKEAEFSIHVTNNDRGLNTKPCTVNTELLDFFVTPDGSLKFGSEYKSDRSATDWIKFDADEFTLNPGESRELTGTVKAPLNADGDYWTAVMIGLGSKDKEAESGVQLNLRTASGLFIRVQKRNYLERAEVTDVNVVLPQISEDSNDLPVLRIFSTLDNTGHISFIAKGQAWIYSDKWKKIASIPLSTSRRRVFPTHRRIFEGTMSQPLPAGNYHVRIFMGPDLERGRKFTKQSDFKISEKLADHWAKNMPMSENNIFGFEPAAIELDLTPGRYTPARLIASNNSLNTLSVAIELINGDIPKNWCRLQFDEFTLAHRNRKNTICHVRIPEDAEKGSYTGQLVARIEHSGLTDKNQSNTETRKIPITIKVK